MTAAPTTDSPAGLDALADALAAALGSGREADVDASTRRRAEYTTDASNYRVVPQVVVFARSADDVQAVVRVAAQLGVPVTMRGAGTSIAGNAIGAGIVVDCSRYFHRILELDVDAGTAVVEPGVVLDSLQAAAAPSGLRFGPDPSTHARATLGGMIGNDACGSHALAYGRTSANVEALEVVDASGRRWWTDAPPPDLVRDLDAVAAANLALLRTTFGTFGRQVSGYALETLLPERGGAAGPEQAPGRNLARLLSGSEGTLALITAARVRLVRPPAAVVFVVLGYHDMAAAADATPALLDHPVIAVEGLDRRLVDVVRARGGAVAGLPVGGGWLFVEVGGDTEQAASAAARAMVEASGALDAVVIPTRAQAAALWRIREDGAGLAGRTADGQPAWPGWEDAAVPPARLGAYLRELEALMAAHGLDGLSYGHFGDGCIHLRVDFPLTRDGGADVMQRFLTEAAELVVRHGGSLSGEHGDGRARSGLLPLMYPPAALDAFATVKRAFDPAGLLNPGVLVDPAPVTADLRVPAARAAVDVGPRRPLQLAYPRDAGDLTTAVHRCVGVGKCRADTSASGGVMCPSYLATRDEKDSTRGRARLLQEMANGTLVTDGWRSREVLDSLDLCLSCKGCAVDCPAGVDMASYKSEFLDHHWRGRLRPASHYLLGWLPRWSRLAALAPGLVNALTAAGPWAALAKRLGGIDPARPIPRFAPQTFRAWFAARPTEPRPTAAGEDGGEDVVLWVDSFTDAFDPAVGQAAVAVLEHLGFRVHLPAAKVCCGLTWVSTGQLDGAKRQLARSLDALDGRLADLPVVGLEPSCTALLREDAARLLPADERARGLHGRVVTLAELIAARRPAWQPPDLSATAAGAVLQPHCHAHASLDVSADVALLAKAGVHPTVLAGCCGLAGNFGAEAGHYDVSAAIAAHALLPALAARDDGAPFVADGFSCRTQAGDLTGDRGRHTVQLLAAALPAQPGPGAVG